MQFLRAIDLRNNTLRVLNKVRAVTHHLPQMNPFNSLSGQNVMVVGIENTPRPEDKDQSCDYLTVVDEMGTEHRIPANLTLLVDEQRDLKLRADFFTQEQLNSLSEENFGKVWAGTISDLSKLEVHIALLKEQLDRLRLTSNFTQSADTTQATQ